MALFLLYLLSMMTKNIEENMSKDLLLIGWEEKIETAYRRMQAHGLRHLPVHNDAGEIVGMLSDRDVQRAMISQVDRDSSGTRSFETISFDPDSRVRDYMAWPVLAVDHESDLMHAVHMVLDHRVSALLVRDSGRAVGIVTTDDLLRVLAGYLAEGNGPRWNVRSILEKSANRFDAILV